VCYRYVAPDIIGKEGVVTHLQQTWGGGFSILAYYYYYCSKREKQMMHPIWGFFFFCGFFPENSITSSDGHFYMGEEREREREREREKLVNNYHQGQ